MESQFFKVFLITSPSSVAEFRNGNQKDPGSNPVAEYNFFLLLLQSCISKDPDLLQKWQTQFWIWHCIAVHHNLLFFLLLGQNFPKNQTGRIQKFVPVGIRTWIIRFEDRCSYRLIGNWAIGKKACWKKGMWLKGILEKRHVV